MPRPCLEKLVSLLELGLLCKLIFEARSIEPQICSGSVHVLFAFYKYVQWRQGLNVALVHHHQALTGEVLSQCHYVNLE